MAMAVERSELSTSRLGLMGAVGPLVFTAAWISGTFLQDTYSIRREDISALAAESADSAWVMIFGFVVMGICTVGLGLGLRRALGGTRRQRVGPALVILAGVGIFFSGMFRNDCSSELPACEALIEADEVSWHHYAHDLAGIVTFLSFIFAPLFTGLRLRSLPDWRSLSRPSIVLTPALFLLLIVLLSEVFSGWTGVVQRIIITSAFLWFAVMGLRLLAVADAVVVTGRPSHAEPAGGP